MEQPVTRRAHGEKISLPWLIAVAIVLTAVLVVLLVRLQQANKVISTTPHPSTTLIGHVAPDFTLTPWNGSAGQTVHLAALAGKPVVVNFWAPWCEPCQHEAATFSTVSHAYQAQGVTFIGVAYDSSATASEQFLQKYGITYLCGPDANGTIAASYGITGIPVTVFIDRQGHVVNKLSGAVDAKTLTTNVEALVKG